MSPAVKKLREALQEETSHEVPSGLELSAATGCQPRVTRPGPLATALPDMIPTPDPNTQIKFGQLTPFLWGFVPLLRGSLLVFCQG